MNGAQLWRSLFPPLLRKDGAPTFFEMYDVTDHLGRP